MIGGYRQMVLLEEKDVFITFSVTTSAGDNIKASSTVGTGQISGNALIAITASPITTVTLQLVNATDATIGYGITQIKANLTIFNVAFKLKAPWKINDYYLHGYLFKVVKERRIRCEHNRSPHC